MQHLSNTVASRKAQLQNAKARLSTAEVALQTVEIKLKDHTKELEALKRRTELSKQYNRAAKELIVVLQKLDESRKKLKLVEERSSKAEGHVQGLLSEADDFEVKYRDTKKSYNDLVIELEHMSLS